LCKKLDVDYVEALELAVEPPLLKATFKSGQDSLPCRIRIGELVERPLSTDVLATKTNVGWVVSKGIKAEKAYSVSKLVIDVKGQEPGPKIAVFDDSQDACDSMCDALEVHGFQVQPYYALENLMRDTNSGASFDGMVIDWLVGAGHVGKELEILSRRFPTVPIIVLTGLDPHGAGGAADLASVVARTGAIYFAKPAVTSILVAALMPRAIAHYEQRLGSSR
jgi:ActR/RegA family two-component response regulator